MLEAEIAAGLGEGLRSVAGAVVGHDAGYPDAEAGVVGHRRLEEGDGAFFFLVGQDLREGDAGGVVDADMDELPTAAARAGIAGALAGNAMTDALETTELLDVDMDHLAGMLALVASDRLGRFDISQSRQSSTLEHAADGGGRDADLMGDVLAGPTLPPQRHDALGDQRSGGLWHMGGPRGTVDHAGPPFGLVALDPARHDLGRHAVDARRMGFGESAFYHRQRHLLSTQRRETGILMDVHSDPPVSAEAW